MAEQHVREVFGPPWVREALHRYQDRARAADDVVYQLRVMLRAHDPSLPDPYDGEAWHELERQIPIPWRR